MDDLYFVYEIGESRVLNLQVGIIDFRGSVGMYFFNILNSSSFGCLFFIVLYCRSFFVSWYSLED